MTLLLLIFEFFKTGLFAVGGGMATLPFLYDLADRYGWFTRADVANMLAVSESTPGPLGVNMATYAGVTTSGVLGGLCTTLALVAPSILVILLVASAMDRYRENRFVAAVLRVLRPVSVGLVGAAVLLIVQGVAWPAGGLDWRAAALFAAALALRLLWKKGHPVVFIALGAGAGLLLQL